MKTVKDINYSFHHTRDRLKERYDIDITREQYYELCAMAQDPKKRKLVAVDYQDDVQYTYDLLFPYRENIRVVWSKKRQCITTALPLG